MEVFKTKNARETEKLGFVFGQSLKFGSEPFSLMLHSIVEKDRRALVLELMGELGSGKTTFVKGLTKALGIKGKITSPTYVFIRSYDFPPFKINSQIKNKFYHLDLYRLEGSDHKILNSFDFHEIVNDPSAIITIEWADRFSKKMNSTLIRFDYDDSGRSIRID